MKSLPIPLPVDDEDDDDRRRGYRIQLELDTAFPVRLQTDLGSMRGVARNISEGGMLVEAQALPPIGSRVQVHFEAPGGGHDHRMELEGDVRHHLIWSFKAERGREGLCAFGIRFSRRAGPPPLDLH